MPPFTGRHGIRDFTEPTTATNPKQPCDLPYEGDVFAGNDNNRRAVHAKMKFEAQAAGEEFDSEAAWKSLGGKVEPKTAPEPDDDDVIDYAKAALFLASRGYEIASPEQAGAFVEKMTKQDRASFVADLAIFVPKEKAGDDDSKGSTDGDKGSQDAPPTDPKGEEAKSETKAPAKPPKPSNAPAWKPNA